MEMAKNNCGSTLITQTSPAPAMTNVSAHKLVGRARTKIKVDRPLAKRVPVVLTVLWVRPVVRILQLLVLLEPMPVGQQPFVIHVPLGNTVLWVHPVVHILQLLVLLEPTPVVYQRVKHVAVVLTALWVRPRANHALLGNTTNKPAKRLVKVARWVNTKMKLDNPRA